MFFATMINRFGDFIGAFLALYLTRILHLEPVKAGATISLVFASSMVGSLLSGRVADAIGKKRALVVSQAGSALANLLLAFLYMKTWAPWVIVAGALFGGGARPLIGAVLTDLAPEGRRKEVFGLQYWSINVGAAIGPLVAAFLFDRAIPLLFAGTAACTLTSILLIGRGVRMPAVASTHSSLERHDERGAVKAFFARPILLCFAGLALANSLTYSQTGFALPLTVSSLLGAEGPRFFGTLLSLNAVLVILLSIPVARIFRSWTPLSCMGASGLFYVLGFGLLALPQGRAGLVLSTAIWTLGEIISSVNIGVFLARHSPSNWRGSFQSFMGLFFTGGWTLGPLVAGPLLALGGREILWGATSLLVGVWAVFSLLLDRWDRRIQPMEAL
jgi:MFS family permease